MFNSSKTIVKKIKKIFSSKISFEEKKNVFNKIVEILPTEYFSFETLQEQNKINKNFFFSYDEKEANEEKLEKIIFKLYIEHWSVKLNDSEKIERALFLFTQIREKIVIDMVDNIISNMFRDESLAKAEILRKIYHMNISKEINSKIKKLDGQIIQKYRSAKSAEYETRSSGSGDATGCSPAPVAACFEYTVEISAYEPEIPEIIFKL